jgi:hypothetical protein
MGTDSERYGVGNVNVIIDGSIDRVLGMDRIRMWLLLPLSALPKWLHHV